MKKLLILLQLAFGMGAGAYASQGVTLNKNGLTESEADLLYATIGSSTVLNGKVERAGDTMSGSLIVNATIQAYYFVGDGSSLTNLPIPPVAPETDPIFTAVASTTNWNSAFGWGNHALAGYLTQVSYPFATVPSSISFGVEQVNGVPAYFFRATSGKMLLGCAASNGECGGVNVPSEGIGIMGALADDSYARIKADRFGLTRAYDSSKYYFRADPTGMFIANQETTTPNKIFQVVRTSSQTFVNGSFKYTDGNQAAGKLLQSDAAGVASWQTVSFAETDPVYVAQRDTTGIQSSGGNTRGGNAVDLQTTRTLGSQVASGDYSIIGGGIRNTASMSYSVVSGGYGNTTYGVGSGFSVISGGFNNTASGNNGGYSAVGGGSDNSATGNNSNITGGSQNTANSVNSTVSGGDSNTASGQYSSVIGGRSNTAAGDFSFAAGRRSKANANGSFVLSDSVDADKTNALTNSMLISFTNGAVFRNSEIIISTTTGSKGITFQDGKTMTTNLGRILIGTDTAIGGSNAGIQYSDNRSNRGQIRMNQFGNNAGIAGLTGYKSRGVDVSSFVATQAGDGMLRLTGIAAPLDGTSFNLSGFWTLYVATSGPLTAFVPSYWEAENTDFDGVQRKTFKIDPNGNVGIGLNTDNISNVDRLDVRDGNIRMSSSTFSGALIFPDGTSMTTAATGPSVVTLAGMEATTASAGTQLVVTDASAPYSVCISTGGQGGFVLMNTTLHCQ